MVRLSCDCVVCVDDKAAWNTREDAAERRGVICLGAVVKACSNAHDN